MNDPSLERRRRSAAAALATPPRGRRASPREPRRRSTRSRPSCSASGRACHGLAALARLARSPTRRRELRRAARTSCATRVEGASPPDAEALASRSGAERRARADRLDLTEVLGRGARGRAPPPRDQDPRRARGRVRGHGVRGRRRPRGRDRLVQLRGAQHPPRPPGTRACGTRFYLDLGEPETVAAAHPHLAGADPPDASEQARCRSTRSCPGRCYRRDTPDARHLPVFHQIEGLVVDRGHHLRRPRRHHRDLHHGLLRARHPLAAAAGLLPLHRALGRVRDHLHDLPGRGLPHLLAVPAGSSSAAAGWSTRPSSRRSAIDPERWTGFAFGFGIDRCAQMRHEIADMRVLLENDVRFLSSSEGRSACASPCRGCATSPLSTGDAGRPRRDPRRSRSGRRGLEHVGEGLDDVVVARVEEIAAIEGADRIRRVVVDAGDGGRSSRLRRLELRRRRPRAAGPGRGGAARRASRSPGARCGVWSPTGCSARRASWACRRRRGHPGAEPTTGGAGAGDADHRGAGHRARRRLRHHRRGQPARRLVHRRGGPRPRRPARTALRPPPPSRPEPCGPDRRPIGRRRRRSRSRSACARASPPGCSPASGRALARRGGAPARPWPGCGRSTTSSTPPTT